MGDFMNSATSAYGIIFLTLLLWACALPSQSQAAEVSGDTQVCLDCHASLHPGIVEAWKQSRHAQITPGEAMQVQGLSRKVSSETVPEPLQQVSVGCAECHTLRADTHADSFDHNGYEVHTVVSPDDCATCHSVEREQYAGNIMAHAYANLVDNSLYQQLTVSIDGQITVQDGHLHSMPPDDATEAESCLYCHGTKLEVGETETRDTYFGPMDFPKIHGWPNQGSGRINLDGSKGACTPCHTRHQFSMAEARKPYTCKECHVGPDVPAYKVYSASKHGSIFASHWQKWDFDKTPWTVGKDFTAPTCATCHMSLLVTPDEEVVAERTHALSPRLPWRIFGLIYAHPQPKSPETSSIRNASGVQLPTNLDGSFVSDALIDQEEMDKRQDALQRVCRSCHDQAWVDGHWQRFENTIEKTNDSTKTATGLMAQAWEAGLAQGLPQGSGIFDEFIEKLWSDTWLIHANHIRFASAMSGGGDYGVFADGRYELSGKIRQMHDWIEGRQALQEVSQHNKTEIGTQ